LCPLGMPANSPVPRPQASDKQLEAPVIAQDLQITGKHSRATQKR